jgi:2,4-dienoyl-CoA reductase-like NADH-dependent reductase (Old Yellow Enzyme family)
MESMKNRLIFFLAVNTGYTKNGVPERRFLDFYSERSGRGLHCAIIGNVAIPNGFGTNTSTPRIDANKIWKEIAEAISNKGTLPGIQLSTTWENYVGAKAFIAKTPVEQLDFYKYVASRFDNNYIKAQFSSLEKATSFAVDAGFKHFQLHAAHGYFFNLILDNRFSKHHGLATELTQEWLESTRQAEIETSVRISTLTGASEFDLEQSSFLEEIMKIPFDYHDLSEGFYNINKKLIYPSIKSILAGRINRNIELALRFPKNNFIASGKSHALKHEDFPGNIHIGICRDLIANANFLNEKDRGCQNKMKCHYYSRGQSSMTCGLWEEA